MLRAELDVHTEARSPHLWILTISGALIFWYKCKYKYKYKYKYKVNFEVTFQQVSEEREQQQSCVGFDLTSPPSQLLPYLESK